MRVSSFAMLLIAGVTGVFALPVRGQSILSSARFEALNRAIPDGDLTGLVDAHEVSGLPSNGLTAVEVELSLSGLGAGGYTGDLYVTLWHAGTQAVLLNRPGRTVANPFGYSDPGDLNITLFAGAGRDVHNYREALSGGNATTPLAGPLTGGWEPDGRSTDPLSVLDTDPRTAGLEAFQGTDPNGVWALLLIDASAGGAMQLDGWGLMITTVPEPVAISAMVAAGLLAWSFLRGRRLTRS